MRYDSKYTGFLVLVLVGVLGIMGCSDDRFSVENPNAPDRDLAIQEPSDIQSILNGGYTSWWQGTYENTIGVYQSGPHFHAWGDALSTTNAFSGFWNVGTNEPRVEIPNTTLFGDLGIVEVPWENLNSAISSANDVIRQIEDNEDFVIENQQITQGTRAAAYFLRGLSYGYLANIYDQAYIVGKDFDPESDLQELEFRPFPEVLSQARSDLEQARQILDSQPSSAEPFGNVLPWSQTPDRDRLQRIANSFEARFIISTDRGGEAEQSYDIPWSEVQTLVADGIQTDIVMQMDGVQWGNGFHYVSGLYWYWRVDNRIISKMAAQNGAQDYPVKYPEDQAGSPITPAKTTAEEDEGDARLCPATGEESGGESVDVAASSSCWFAYDGDQSFYTLPRGPRLQSNYFWLREPALQQWFFQPFAAGPSPIFDAEENRLMRAEAAIQADGNVQEARSLVNNGSRVNVGELDPLPNGASEEEVMEAIEYERDIQLYRVGLGLQYFDLRRRGELQTGTPVHMPVPATELETPPQAELYSFGGANNAGQPGTASGDNAWCDQGNLSCDGPFSERSQAPSSAGSFEVQSIEELGLIPSNFVPSEE